MEPLVFLAVILVVVIYLIIDLARSNPNAFFDKWSKNTHYIWLPFYALWRLIREIFFDKR